MKADVTRTMSEQLWYALSEQELVQQLNSNFSRGLTATEVIARREQFGYDNRQVKWL